MNVKPINPAPAKAVRFGAPNWSRLARNLSKQDTALFMLSTFAVPVVKTAMFAKAFQNEGFTDRERKLLFTQEWIRQTTSTALWMVTSLVSYVLLKKVFPKQSAIGRLLTSNLISSFPDTFIRPFITAKISRRVLEEQNETAVQPQPEAEKSETRLRSVTNPLFVGDPIPPIQYEAGSFGAMIPAQAAFQARYPVPAYSPFLLGYGF